MLLSEHYGNHRIISLYFNWVLKAVVKLHLWVDSRLTWVDCLAIATTQDDTQRSIDGQLINYAVAD
jgi:hypothetical protein